MSEHQKAADGTQVLERDQVEPKEPDMYRVLLLNDDYTTMEFVIQILVEVFHKDVPTATGIMLDVHRHGSGVASVYTWDIANTKAEEVHRRARDHGFPLRCRIEKA